MDFKKNGNVVAYTREKPNGDVDLVAYGGNLIAYYRAATNETKTATGSRVGSGNLLAQLVPR